MVSLVAALSAGHKAGLAIAGAVFIAFAVSSALLIPARWPQFPSGAGLRPFLAATGALFVGMMLAVYFLARESESAAKEPPAAIGTAAHVAKVSEVEYKIRLPATTVERGRYTFDLENDGTIAHDLTIKGPGISKKGTPKIQPGQKAKLEVDLQPGTYDLYCSVAGHKALGMDVKLTVT